MSIIGKFQAIQEAYYKKREKKLKGLQERATVAAQRAETEKNIRMAKDKINTARLDVFKARTVPIVGDFKGAQKIRGKLKSGAKKDVSQIKKAFVSDKKQVSEGSRPYWLQSEPNNPYFTSPKKTKKERGKTITIKL